MWMAPVSALDLATAMPHSTAERKCEEVLAAAAVDERLITSWRSDLDYQSQDAPDNIKYDVL